MTAGHFNSLQFLNLMIESMMCSSDVTSELLSTVFRLNAIRKKP